MSEIQWVTCPAFERSTCHECGEKLAVLMIEKPSGMICLKCNPPGPSEVEKLRAQLKSWNDTADAVEVILDDDFVEVTDENGFNWGLSLSAAVAKLRADLKQISTEKEELSSMLAQTLARESALRGELSRKKHRLRAVHRAARKKARNIEIMKSGSVWWHHRGRVKQGCSRCYRALPSDGICRRCE